MGRSLFLLFLLAALGCQKSETYYPYPTDPGISDHPNVNLSVAAQVQQNQNSKIVDKCETAYFDIQAKIANFVDDVTPAVSSTDARGNSLASNERFIELGPAEFIEPLSIPKTKDVWKTWEDGWPQIAIDFQTLDRRDLNAVTFFVSRVRSVAMDDRLRLINALNRYITPYDAPVVLSAWEKYKTCLRADELCKDKTLTSEEKSLLQNNPIYRRYVRVIWNEDLKKSERRAASDELYDRLKEDALRLEFVKFKAARYDADHITLRVPLDPGVFAQSKNILEAFFSVPWSGPKLKIEAEWVSHETNPNAFQIFYNPTIGERAFVVRNPNSMNLFARNYTTAISHEFGHVLGFRDNYFTVWSPERCIYLTYQNPKDIMSTSYTGAVLPDHHHTLTKEYTH